MSFLKWLTSKENRILFVLFAFLYVVLAFHTYRDYGMTWDEPDWYGSGQYLLKHYKYGIGVTDKESVDQIFTIEQASHNYIYPAFVRVAMHADQTQIQPERSHLVNLLFGLLIFWAVFEALFYAYRNAYWAILGPIFLFLTFRFSGDIPANPKDMPFAVLYMVTLVSIYFFREKWNNLAAEGLVVGSLIGLTSSVRVLGLTLLPVWVLYRFYEYWTARRTNRVFPVLWGWIRQDTVIGLLVFVVSQFWMMACWPYLGSNYFGNYPIIFKASSQFSWDGPVPFLGKLTFTHDFPWYYLLLWLLITIPLFLIGFFLISLFLKKNERSQKLYLLLLLNLLFQVGLFIVLKPTVYNGIRHYLFLVPIFSLMGTMGLIEYFMSRVPLWSKRIIGGLVGINIILVLVQFFQLYPYQYIYFNELVGGLKGAAGNFETDYWGVSLKEAAQWLAANEAKDPKHIYTIKNTGIVEQIAHFYKNNMKPDNQTDHPDYSILLQDGNKKDDLTPEMKKYVVYTVQREGVPLVYVLKFTTH